MKQKGLFVLYALFCSTFTLSYSQTEKEIVSNYRNALQKSVDLNDIQTFELKGNIEIQRISLPVSMFFKSPRHLRLEMTFQSLKFLQISNDSLKWEYNSMNDINSITPINENTGDWQSQNSTFDFANNDLLNYQQLNYKLKFIRKDKMDSLTVYVLELSKDKKSKSKTTFYINAENSLLYKVTDEKGYRYFANYTFNESITFPRFIIESTSDNSMQMHFDQIYFNQPLDDSLFIIPQHAFEKTSKTQNDVSKLLKHGDQLYINGQYDSANFYYTKAIKINGNNYQAFNARGLTKIEQKDYYDAIADFTRASEINPSFSKAYNNRGLAKFYLGDKDGAIKDYTKAIELESDFVIAFKNRGLAYLHLENYELATQDFSKAIKLKPEDGESHFKYAVTIAQQEKFEEALQSYQRAVTYQFLNAEVYNYKGVAEYHLEKYDSAKKSFKLAVNLEPANLQYIENYGRALYELGEFKAAAVQFEIYIKKQNDQPEIHNLNGLCKYQEENYKGAIKDFSKSIELSANNATYFDNRAAAKEMIEDYEGAIKDYGESIRLYPNDASVFYKRGLIKLHVSKKMEGCLDLATANEMKYEPAKEAILKNCN